MAMEKVSKVRSASRRVATVFGLGFASVLAMAAPSFAVDPASPSDVLSGPITTLGSDMLIVAGLAATAGVLVLGARKGWRLIKTFI